MLKILFPVSNYEIALIPSNLTSRSNGQTLTTSLQSLDVCFAFRPAEVTGKLIPPCNPVELYL